MANEPEYVSKAAEENLNALREEGVDKAFPEYFNRQKEAALVHTPAETAAPVVAVKPDAPQVAPELAAVIAPTNKPEASASVVTPTAQQTPKTVVAPETTPVIKPVAATPAAAPNQSLGDPSIAAAFPLYSKAQEEEAAVAPTNTQPLVPNEHSGVGGLKVLNAVTPDVAPVVVASADAGPVQPSDNSGYLAFLDGIKTTYNVLFHRDEAGDLTLSLAPPGDTSFDGFCAAHVSEALANAGINADGNADGLAAYLVNSLGFTTSAFVSEQSQPGDIAFIPPEEGRSEYGHIATFGSDGKWYPGGSSDTPWPYNSPEDTSAIEILRNPNWDVSAKQSQNIEYAAAPQHAFPVMTV